MYIVAWYVWYKEGHVYWEVCFTFQVQGLLKYILHHHLGLYASEDHCRKVKSTLKNKHHSILMRFVRIFIAIVNNNLHELWNAEKSNMRFSSLKHREEMLIKFVFMMYTLNVQSDFENGPVCSILSSSKGQDFPWQHSMFFLCKFTSPDVVFHALQLSLLLGLSSC